MPARRLRLVIAAALLAALVGLGATVRLVRVAGDHEQAWLWAWAWQTGAIEFINSITGRPVSIRFSLPWRFGGFAAATDPGTEEYYTGGEYAWNDRLAAESARGLQCCSDVGITIRVGERRFHESRGGCVRLGLVWPPF